jgi:hypothetical protein
MIEFIAGILVGIMLGVVVAALYLHSHEKKFIAAVAQAYGKTTAEITALKNVTAKL